MPRKVDLTTTRSPMSTKSVTGSWETVSHASRSCSEAAHDRFQTDIRALLWPSLGRAQNHVRVKEVAKRIKVPRVPCLEAGSHHLHVLLRRGLLHQPSGFEGF